MRLSAANNTLYISFVDDKASCGISFKDFCLLCKELAGESSYNSKTNIIQQFVNEKTRKGENYVSSIFTARV